MGHRLQVGNNVTLGLEPDSLAQTQQSVRRAVQWRK